MFDNKAERKIIIERVHNWTTICPTQYSLWDINGKEYYVRYRYGTIQVVDEDTNKIIYEDVISDDIWDGYLPFDEMVAILTKKCNFDFTRVRTMTEGLRWDKLQEA